MAVEELRKKYAALKTDDKEGRERCCARSARLTSKTPPMYDKANLLVHTEPVPDTYILPRGDSMRKGEKVTPAHSGGFRRRGRS